jgi:hypothetical protein
VVLVVDPPPLPARLSRPVTVVLIGSVAWAVLAAALLVAWLAAGRPLDIWFSTAVAGVLLGGFGYGVFSWQRAAGRRGSRTAQQGAD